MKESKRFFNRLMAVFLTVCMVITMVGVPKASAATIKLNKKTATVTVGKTVQLKVSGTKKKVTWTSSKKSVATVSSTGKITGVSVGNTIVVADSAGVSYDIYVTVEKPIEYDFSGVTQTAWHKDWIQGVNWQQVDQHDGESFTCKLLNTSQKVKWTGKVIAAHKPTNPVKSTDEIINGSKKGVLSGTDSSNTIVFNGEGSDYITVEVTATTSDNQKKFYIFYNDKDGSSSIATGPKWNDYITLE